MFKVINKIIAFSVIFCLVFEQSGFAQVAPQMPIPAYINGYIAPDRFRPVQLRSLSFDANSQNFDLYLDPGDSKNLKPKDIALDTKILMQYFRIGLALPNTAFWVNLRPDAPTDIIDTALEKTDLGKVMLAADVELKKSLARFTSPKTEEGKKYWDALYSKAQQVFGNDDISIPTVTRPWIVPGEVIIRETQTNCHILKATLKVCLEQDHISLSGAGKDAAVMEFDDPRLKEINEFSSQLIRDIVIPKLTREVNSSKKFADLRQVFYSLILAQWYKEKHRGTQAKYAQSIDSKELEGLTSQKSWSKDTYFKAYKKSFEQGEYNLSETMQSASGMVVRQYVSGGITGLASALTPKSSINGTTSTGLRVTGQDGGIETKGMLRVNLAGTVQEIAKTEARDGGERTSEDTLFGAEYERKLYLLEKLGGQSWKDKERFAQELSGMFSGLDEFNEFKDFVHEVNMLPAGIAQIGGVFASAGALIVPAIVIYPTGNGMLSLVSGGVAYMSIRIASWLAAGVVNVLFSHAESLDNELMRVSGDKINFSGDSGEYNTNKARDGGTMEISNDFSILAEKKRLIDFIFSAIDENKLITVEIGRNVTLPLVGMLWINEVRQIRSYELAYPKSKDILRQLVIDIHEGVLLVREKGRAEPFLLHIIPYINTRDITFHSGNPVNQVRDGGTFRLDNYIYAGIQILEAKGYSNRFARNLIKASVNSFTFWERARALPSNNNARDGGIQDAKNKADIFYAESLDGGTEAVLKAQIEKTINIFTEEELKFIRKSESLPELRNVIRAKINSINEEIEKKEDERYSLYSNLPESIEGRMLDQAKVSDLRLITDIDSLENKALDLIALLSMFSDYDWLDTVLLKTGKKYYSTMVKWQMKELIQLFLQNRSAFNQLVMKALDPNYEINKDHKDVFKGFGLDQYTLEEFTRDVLLSATVGNFPDIRLTSPLAPESRGRLQSEVLTEEKSKDGGEPTEGNISDDKIKKDIIEFFDTEAGLTISALGGHVSSVERVMEKTKLNLEDAAKALSLFARGDPDSQITVSTFTDVDGKRQLMFSKGKSGRWEEKEEMREVIKKAQESLRLEIIGMGTSLNAKKDGGTFGGIDFINALTATPLLTPAMNQPELTSPAPIVSLQELDSKWLNIQEKIKQGQMPYKELKELSSCCYARKDAVKQKEAVAEYVINLLKMEEERAIATSQELKDVIQLVVA